MKKYCSQLEDGIRLYDFMIARFASQSYASLNFSLNVSNALSFLVLLYVYDLLDAA